MTQAADSSMTLAEFHELCVPHKRPLDSKPITFWACGVGEEAGEVQGVVKKAEHREIWSSKGMPAESAAYDRRLLHEAGNLLFYLRQVLEIRGLTLEQAARRQLELLAEMNPGDR